MGELPRLINQERMEISALKIKPARLVQMLKLIDAGTISGKIAKTVFAEMLATGADPAQIVKEKGLVQMSDAGELLAAVQAVLAANPEQVQQYREGKTKVMAFLVGQLMKQTKGKANPQLANKLLEEELKPQ
jgi:aspartyl-tRNA(Asn)/glutamyl-tRNA(Gln) amidotransferase subunit B